MTVERRVIAPCQTVEATEGFFAGCSISGLCELPITCAKGRKSLVGAEFRVIFTCRGLFLPPSMQLSWLD